MKYLTIESISRQVYRQYIEIEFRIRNLMRLIDFKCPEKCGYCCASHEIESTVVEMYPLMMHILRSGRIEDLIGKLARKKESDPCIFFEPYPGCSCEGFCTVYRFRPLICRMFSFSGRKRKDGSVEPQVCRILRARDPEGVTRLGALCREGVVPEMAPYFMKIAGLDPQRGYRLLPFDDALREAIDVFYWRKPRYFHNRKSA